MSQEATFKLFEEAITLLREISNSGYIKTKHTSDETNLEGRVDDFIKRVSEDG